MGGLESPDEVVSTVSGETICGALDTYSKMQARDPALPQALYDCRHRTLPVGLVVQA